MKKNAYVEKVKHSEEKLNNCVPRDHIFNVLTNSNVSIMCNHSSGTGTNMILHTISDTRLKCVVFQLWSWQIIPLNCMKLYISIRYSMCYDNTTFKIFRNKNGWMKTKYEIGILMFQKQNLRNLYFFELGSWLIINFTTGNQSRYFWCSRKYFSLLCSKL